VIVGGSENAFCELSKKPTPNEKESELEVFVMPLPILLIKPIESFCVIPCPIGI
jgi:hypothetical protein